MGHMKDKLKSIQSNKKLLEKKIKEYENRLKQIQQKGKAGRPHLAMVTSENDVAQDACAPMRTSNPALNTSVSSNHTRKS